MKKSYLWVISALVLTLSVSLLVGGTQKNPVVTSVVDLPGTLQLSSGATYQLPSYEVTIVYPSSLLRGTISHINLSIQPLDSSVSTGDPNINKDFRVGLESKLDLSNVQIAPQGLIHTELNPGQAIHFTWNILTDRSSAITGTLWVYLTLTPNGSATISGEQPLLAVPLDIGVKTVLGLSADLAIVLAIFGSLLAIALFIVRWRLTYIRGKSKKKRNDIIR